MKTQENKRWLPVIVIAAALAAWGMILATGAYLATEGKSGGHDGRKLLVVAATTGGFLLFWGGILAISAAKQRQRQTHTKLPDRTDRNEAANR